MPWGPPPVLSTQETQKTDEIVRIVVGPKHTASQTAARRTESRVVASTSYGRLRPPAPGCQGPPRGGGPRDPALPT